MKNNMITDETQTQEYKDTILESSVPLIYVESLNSRHERKEALILICSAAIVLVVVLVSIFVIYFTNLSWQKYLEQFDFESYELSADGSSNANYIGGNIKGNINNGGKDSSEEADIEEQEESEGETDAES